MITFSHDIFSAQATGGISRCMIELMRALDPAAVDWQLWAGKHGSDLLRDALVDPGFAARTVAASGGHATGRLRGSARNEFGFASHVADSGPAAIIVHRTFYAVFDRLIRKRSKHVETLHDMWDERAAALGNRSSQLKSLLKRRALEAADAIVCVSESTRSEMLAIWPHLAARTHVIPHGVRRLSVNPVAVDAERPFFLFVGRRGGYKNFGVVLAALSRAALPDHDLVCFGGGGFDPSERRSIDAVGLTARVWHAAGNDDQLAGYYEAATALLYPSAYEGFGLPILEAMAHGCPVVAAPLTSLPEAGGDAALYADPCNIGEWSDMLVRVCRDRNLTQELAAGGFVRSTSFSWKLTAELHFLLYNSLRA